MKKLSILLSLFILSACVNPYCQNMANHTIDNYTFKQCIDIRSKIPGRMGVIPSQEIDQCAAKAAAVTKQMCGK